MSHFISFIFPNTDTNYEVYIHNQLHELQRPLFTICVFHIVFLYARKSNHVLRRLMEMKWENQSEAQRVVTVLGACDKINITTSNTFCNFHLQQYLHKSIVGFVGTFTQIGREIIRYSFGHVIHTDNVNIIYSVFILIYSNNQMIYTHLHMYDCEHFVIAVRLHLTLRFFSLDSWYWGKLKI